MLIIKYNQPITPGTVNGCAVGDGFRHSGQCVTPVVLSGCNLLQHDSHILRVHKGIHERGEIKGGGSLIR